MWYNFSMSQKDLIQQLSGLVLETSKRNGFIWFYEVHLLPAVKSAEEILKLYPEADKNIVMPAIWLHDIAKISQKDIEGFEDIHPVHHKEGAKMAADILSDYRLSDGKTRMITDCILKHRNSGEYKAEALEEKIVAVADTLSHFRSVFYLIHFKFHPNSTIAGMKEKQLAKMKRDWADLSLLPGVCKLAENEFNVLEKLIKS